MRAGMRGECVCVKRAAIEMDCEGYAMSVAALPSPATSLLLLFRGHRFNIPTSPPLPLLTGKACTACVECGDG